MRPRILRGPASRILFASFLAIPGVACSLLNSLDDVKPELAGGDGGPDVLNPGEGDGGDGGTGPAKGAIVVGGAAEGDGGLVHVLTALAPETGAELPQARRNMTVAGVRYDGVRDLWYVFEAGGHTYFPTPNDPVFLHVLTLDTFTGTWATLQTLKVPTIISFTHIGVLRDRLVYVAYHPGADSQALNDLVTINTANPTNISIADTQPLERPVMGVLAARGLNQAPGTLNLLRYLGCGEDGGLSCLDIQHVTVSSSTPAAFGTVTPLGEIFGSPAFGSFDTGSIDLIAFKTPTSGTAAPLKSYDPRTVQSVGNAIQFNTNDAFLKPMAVAECLGQALITGTNQDLGVYAVPLTATDGVQAVARMAHSGQGVYFEPFTSTVLAPFSQSDNYELTAMKLAGDKVRPSLTVRTAADWNPPKDLRPEIVTTRTPFQQPCAP